MHSADGADTGSAYRNADRNGGFPHVHSSQPKSRFRCAASIRAFPMAWCGWGGMPTAPFPARELMMETGTCRIGCIMISGLPCGGLRNDLNAHRVIRLVALRVACFLLTGNASERVRAWGACQGI